MSDFVYVKGEGKERWQLVPNTKEAVAEAVRRGARFTTVLSVDKDVDEARSEDNKVSYRGPLYFDLDSTDEGEALEDLRRLLLSLYVDYGVGLNDVMVWATGGKGFHVLVPSKVFSKGRGSQHLPYTYGNMASRFDLVTLDYAIYSGGKGRMWRIPNQRRPNDRYKVSISVAEALSADISTIQDRTRSPGPEPEEPADPQLAPQFAALYNACLFRPKKIESVPNDLFKDVTEHPDCVSKLLQDRDVNPERRFNQLALTLSSYLVAKGKGLDEALHECEYFLRHHDSSVYKTYAERERHLRSIFKYVQVRPREYGFTCSYAKKAVKDAACRACPIGAAQVDKNHGIEEIDGAYYKIQEGGPQQISTFVIKPIKTVKIVDGPQVEYSINATISSTSGAESHVVFSQPDWISKQGLLKRLPSPLYAYWGGDPEVQKIFHLIANLNVPEQKGVRVVGMHRHDDKWHLVTHEGSLAGDGTRDELLLVDDSFYRSRLLSTRPADREFLQDVVQHLWRFNDFSVAMPILGWHVLTLFKERIFYHTQQFPILFVFGEAGAGKTLTVMNLRRLWAMEGDYTLKSVGDQTKFTLTKAAAGSKGPPLYLDEFKSSQFRDYQVKNIHALIRTAYNNESADRGNSDQTVNVYPMTAPIAFTGEQIIGEKAVRDRIIEVQMTRRLSEPHFDSWKTLESMPVERLGRSLLDMALTVPDSEIVNAIDTQMKSLDESFEDRPRLNMAMLMAGLGFLQRLLDEHNVQHDLEFQCAKYRRWAAGRQNEERTERLLSDVDRIFEVFDMMTATERMSIRHGDHYQVVGDVLQIDMKRTYAYFGRFVSEFQLKDVEAMTFHSFSKLVRTEPYFLTKDVERHFETGFKLCYEFSISKMIDKGLAVKRLTTPSAGPMPKVEVDV